MYQNKTQQTLNKIKKYSIHKSLLNNHNKIKENKIIKNNIKTHHKMNKMNNLVISHNKILQQLVK
jgi:hypothetical protein